MKRLWKLAATVVLLAALFSGALVLRHIRSNRLRRKSQAEFALLTRAKAEQGDARAQAELCHLYAYGIGLPRDFSQALHWCQASAQTGNAWGEEGIASIFYGGDGVPRDYGQAFQWFQKAANQHLAVAEYSLAFLYHSGLGVKKDDATAVLWYRKAAEQKYAKAETALGTSYEEGKGVPQNYKLAAYWYQQAVDQNERTAKYNLGRMYRWGVGIPRDVAQGRRLLRDAADQGDEGALRATTLGLSPLCWTGLILGGLVGMMLSVDSLSRLCTEGGLHGTYRRILAGGGLLMLIDAAFDWYGYTHFKFRSPLYGFTSWTLVHWAFVPPIIALLIYIVRAAPRPAPAEIAPSPHPPFGS